MSTEAPRSPIPPRPGTPPRPAAPPAPADQDDPAAEPPPAASARFPDVPPPVDRDWLLGAPRPPADAGSDPDSGTAARIQDLLAPFEKAREGRASSDEDPQSPPPPPASARLPDTPPASAADSATDTVPRPRAEPAETAPQADAPVPATDDDPSGEAEAEADDVTTGPGDTPPLPPRPTVPPQPAAPPTAAAASQTPEETTARLRPVPGDTAPPAPAPRTPPPPGAEPARPEPPHAAEASPRATAARRAVGAVDLAPGPGAGRPFVFFARPAMYDDSTTRLRPVGAWVRPRAAAAAACVVIGLGLIGGAVTGSWLTGESAAGGARRSAYTVTGDLWHSVPVDRLFPPALKGDGAGPGGADRSWTRIAVAPDSGCGAAFDPLLQKALAPAGCLRLLRATYTDATRSHVTTVGLLFTKADADAMQALRNRFTEEGLDRRPDLMPRPYAAKGTAAADFGDAQRASWTISVLPDAPVVAYAVTGFADGRTVTEPEPATEAMGSDTTSAPAQAGLGHEAKGIADRVERGLRKTIAAAEKKR